MKTNQAKKVKPAQGSADGNGVTGSSVKRQRFPAMFLKLAPLLLASYVACGVSVAVTQWLIVGPDLKMSAQKQALSTASCLARSGKLLVEAKAEAALREMMTEILWQNPAIESVSLFNTQGSIQYDSRGHEGETIRGFTGPFSQPQALEIESGNGLTSSVVRAPIFFGEEFWGGAQLCLRPVDSVTAADQAMTWLPIASVCILVGWAVSRIATQYHSRFARLAEVLDGLRSGNLAARSGFESNDEAGFMAHAVDALATELVVTQARQRALTTALEERILARTKALEAVTREAEALRSTQSPGVT